MARAQPRDEHFRRGRENPRFAGGKEMNRLAGQYCDLRKHLAECRVEAAEERHALRAEVVLGRGELKGEDSPRREPARRLTIKFLGIKAIELRRLGLRHVDNHHVEYRLGSLQKQPAVQMMDAQAPIGARGSPRLRKVPLGDIENGRIEFHVIDALESRMLERLLQAAVDSAADQQQPLRGGVFEQGEMHRFLRRGSVRNRRHHQAVLVEAARAFGFDNDEIAVAGIPAVDEPEALPEPLERSLFEPRRREGQEHKPARLR